MSIIIHKFHNLVNTFSIINLFFLKKNSKNYTVNTVLPSFIKDGNEKENFPYTTKEEMFENPKVLGIISGLLLVMGVVPGMPTVPFLTMSVMSGLFGFKKQNRSKNRAYF